MIRPNCILNKFVRGIGHCLILKTPLYMYKNIQQEILACRGRMSFASFVKNHRHADVELGSFKCNFRSPYQFTILI